MLKSSPESAQKSVPPWVDGWVGSELKTKPYSINYVNFVLYITELRDPFCMDRFRAGP